MKYVMLLKLIDIQEHKLAGFQPSFEYRDPTLRSSFTLPLHVIYNILWTLEITCTRLLSYQFNRQWHSATNVFASGRNYLY